MCIVAMPDMALGFPVKLACLTERGHTGSVDYLIRKTGSMNEECCGSREEGQANDIPATLECSLFKHYGNRTFFLP